MELEYIKENLFIIEDKDIKIDVKVLEFEKIISCCNSDSNLLNEIILNEDLLNHLIDATDLFGKDIKYGPKDITVIKYREWLDNNFFSEIATKKKMFVKRDVFDELMREWCKKNIEITFNWESQDILLFKNLLDIIENDNEFILFLEEYRNNNLLSFLDNLRLISERTMHDGFNNFKESLQTQEISYGSSYYKAHSRFTIEYIIPKNIFYKRYYKFPYFIENINNKTVFEVKSIFNFNKKFIIDYDIGSLNFWKLGEINEDWVHCHDLSYHFTELVLKKLLLFKYLKNKHNKIRDIYNNLFHNFNSNTLITLWIKTLKILKTIKISENIYLKEIKMNNEMKEKIYYPVVFYLYGPSGSGKTSWVKELFGNELYEKSIKAKSGLDYWINYEGQDIVLLDEYNTKINWISLIELLNDNNVIIEIKTGKFVPFNAKYIFITNTKNLNESYGYRFLKNYLTYIIEFKGKWDSDIEKRTTEIVFHKECYFRQKFPKHVEKYLLDYPKSKSLSEYKDKINN
ncbi:24749_t:CDS:2 [Cetraspora pellucida]|uniref:24749_t:CDS:1 n=1 Tax=Cetraspora pellucida TaxID=1433469 RepID=A0A9N9IVK5_9GLOM|nr:24749_t:CDS:2 [Cetraspora pellucida]